MLKRTSVRLLLFGIPFTFSYLVSRPSPSNLDGPSRVAIPVRNLVIAVDRSGRLFLTERIRPQEIRPALLAEDVIRFQTNQ